MLAHLLALAVGFGSFSLYMAAFFFPEVHRKYDFTWSGVGLFYALVLWFGAGRITGSVLLAQLASVALLGWFGWQTLSLRREMTPVDQQTQLSDSAKSIGEVLKNKTAQLRSTVQQQVRSRAQGSRTGAATRTRTSVQPSTDIREQAQAPEQSGQSGQPPQRPARKPSRPRRPSTSPPPSETAPPAVTAAQDEQLAEAPPNQDALDQSDAAIAASLFRSKAESEAMQPAESNTDLETSDSELKTLESQSPAPRTAPPQSSLLAQVKPVIDRAVALALATKDRLQQLLSRSTKPARPSSATRSPLDTQTQPSDDYPNQSLQQTKPPAQPQSETDADMDLDDEDWFGDSPDEPSQGSDMTAAIASATAASPVEPLADQPPEESTTHPSTDLSTDLPSEAIASDAAPEIELELETEPNPENETAIASASVETPPETAFQPETSVDETPVDETTTDKTASGSEPTEDRPD